MGIQTTVFSGQALGLPGTRYDNSPLRALSYILNSVSAAYNVVGGVAMTISAEGEAKAGNAGNFGFAGILANPEIQALYGAGGIPLNPSLSLPNGVVAPCVSMGRIFVTLTTSANVGDLVVFDNVTGVLSAVAPGDPLPGASTFAHAEVIRYNLAAPGVGVIEISPYLVAPV